MNFDDDYDYDSDEPESKFEELLTEFKDQRDQIKNMIIEIEDLRSQIKLLFPNTLDARNRRFLEDKVKTMVAFYNVLLDMRKEVSMSIKSELEARRKIKTGEIDPSDIDGLLDIRDLSKQVEKFQAEKVKAQNKRTLKQKTSIVELQEKGIEIPGLKELKETEEI